MAEVSYETLLPEIYVHAAGVPEPTAINAIRNACVEFCRDSMYLTVDFDPVNVVAGLAEYELDAPTGYLITRVIDPIYIDDQIVRGVPPALLRTMYGAAWREKTGTPRKFVNFTPNTITLVPIPETTIPVGLTGQYVLQPTRASTTFDSDVLERYREELAAGALARITMEPGTPYYDPTRSAGFYNLFRRGVSSARLSAMKAHVSADTAVRMRRW